MTAAEAIRRMPLCLVGCLDDAETINDLWWLVRIELDLIEEGQDGTDYSRQEVTAIRNYLLFLSNHRKNP